jgi:rhodanese-related sulfurtransferase
MMDVAVPANMHVGLHQDELVKQGLSLTARDAIASLGRPEILLVDLRETAERNKHGMLTGALHAPYGGIEESLRPGGMLREVAAASGRRIVFFCAFGERSAMAVKAAKQAGLPNTAHIEAAWTPEEGRRPRAARVVCSRLTAPPASIPPRARSARPPEERRRIRSCARE